jgi:hypothetical protein
VDLLAYSTLRVTDAILARQMDARSPAELRTFSRDRTAHSRSPHEERYTGAWRRRRATVVRGHAK